MWEAGRESRGGTEGKRETGKSDGGRMKKGKEGWREVNGELR